MKKIRRHNGFSLTEVLLAVGTLAIGMIFIGGTFMTGIHFSTIATERTIAAAATDEAFAKIELFGVNLADPNLATDKLTPFEMLNPIAANEFTYPSTTGSSEKQYYWSALCRPVYPGDANRLVQVTVLVSRKVGSGTMYPGGASKPTPVQVGVSTVPGAGNENMLVIDSPTEQAYINGGYTIVDSRTGMLYRVLRREIDAPNTVILDSIWQGEADSVWVIPPPVGGGRYPCIAVYQKVIRF